VYRRPPLAFPQVSAGDFDIAITGKLPAAQLAFGDQFEPGPLKMVSFEAPLGCRALRQQELKNPPADPRNASILADLNAEFDGHPVGVPPGILRECEKHQETSAQESGAMFV
jgi:hypothetical protein